MEMVTEIIQMLLLVTLMSGKILMEIVTEIIVIGLHLMQMCGMSQPIIP